MFPIQEIQFVEQSIVTDIGILSISNDRLLDLAPEIVEEKEYDEAVDVWCLGILMYEMLYGFPPFHSKKKEETFEKIRTQQLVFHDEIKAISDDAKDLLTKVKILRKWSLKFQFLVTWI